MIANEITFRFTTGMLHDNIDYCSFKSLLMESSLERLGGTAPGVKKRRSISDKVQEDVKSSIFFPSSLIREYLLLSAGVK